MKELKDYTTEELKAELKRRAIEAKKSARANKEYKTDYLYWIATVEGAQEWGRFDQFKYRVKTSDQNVPLDVICSGAFNMISGLCKKADRPRVGDTVKLRLRYTNYMKKTKHIFWRDSKICEIIKRCEDEKV